MKLGQAISALSVDASAAGAPCNGKYIPFGKGLPVPHFAPFSPGLGCLGQRFILGFAQGFRTELQTQCTFSMQNLKTVAVSESQKELK